MRNRLIPIAIVITQDHGGNVNYTAFSPKDYNIGSETRKRLYDKFMKKLCTHISYDPNNPLNNNSSIGKVLEIHTRFIRVPLDQRRVLVNFSITDNPHCNYKPIHHESPVKFGILTEEEYNTHHQFTRVIASHDFV
jgi:hypothetical protein